jgi:glycosyltransferase involved in cell wall biosynthesis
MVVELGIQPLVTFSGPIYGPDRLAMYADADAFAITPNIFEETTLSSLEAAACGTQCVLTRQCEIPGLEEAGAGRTVECREEAIAAALVEALQPGIPEARGARARSMVEARFTVKAIAKQHERVFEEVVDATRDAAA